MSSLKMFRAAIVIMVFSILVGCSDNITSSGETGSPQKGEGVISSVTEESLPVIQTYRTQIRVKPHRAYKFDEISTGFDRFYSIDINNLTVNTDTDKEISECGDILVYSSQLSKGSLSCHSKGFEVKEITVENTGSSFLDLNVTMKVFKQKKVPVIMKEE
ncbi:MAG TPA: hypothetical protein PKC91_07285 [Ignavibacteria bacterium]|nr:hypothetical protein [Ignavibacteria bacterium]